LPAEWRAIDQCGQVIDVLVSEKRDLAATRRFFIRALEHGTCPTEVSTDRALAYPRTAEELMPAACHIVKQYATNPIESDHGRLRLLAVSSGFGDQVSVVPAWRVDEGVMVSLAA
jgi:transposase-like protein